MVAHLRCPAQFDAYLGEFFGEIGGVCVHYLAHEEFGADGNYLSVQGDDLACDLGAARCRVNGRQFAAQVYPHPARVGKNGARFAIGLARLNDRIFRVGDVFDETEHLVGPGRVQKHDWHQGLV